MTHYVYKITCYDPVSNLVTFIQHTRSQAVMHSNNCNCFMHVVIEFVIMDTVCHINLVKHLMSFVFCVRVALDYHSNVIMYALGILQYCL